MLRSRKLRYVAGVALLAVLYFASAKLGLLAAVAQPVVSSAWPPAGIALAALLLFSPRLWPGITLGAFWLNASAGVPLAGAACIAVGNTLEALIGALLLQRVGFRVSLARLRDVLALVLLAAGASTAVSATIGVSSLWLSGAIPSADYGRLWAVWWSGDAIGVLAVTPLLLTWSAMPRTPELLRRAAEAVALVLALVVLTNLFFRSPFSYVYAIFPVATWAALRFGPRGAATATFLVSSLAVWYTVRGLGPFVGATPTQNLFLLQTFMALLAITSLILAAVIAERKRAEGELRQSEEHFRLLIEGVKDYAILMLDPEGYVASWNDGAERIKGYRAKEIVGRHFSRFYPPEDIAAGKPRRDLDIAAVEGRFEEEGWRVRKDGSRFWADVVMTALREESGRLLGFGKVTRDFSERRKAEDALRASEERYRALFESNPQPMWVFDEETHAFLAVNEAACHHYGYSREEFLGMTIRDIRPPEDVSPLLQQLASESQDYVHAGTWRHRKKDGTVIEVEITSHSLVFDGRNTQLILVTDVTERRHLERQLRQAQKMEAIGRLAGGIAHDFNNLLTAILGYADILGKETEGDPLSESVEEIRKAAERAASLTHQLLAFSRQQVLEPKVLDLNALVQNLERMLRRLIREDIELVTVLDPKIGRVRADAGQVEQVIMNLSVNARDAMPKGGTLTIETQDVELVEGDAREHATVRPGRYVMLAVTDTGSGMSDETKSHMFEPFFTTKKKGKGTGLGLATVYGIVKQSEGHISVYSELGLGTTFKIHLPRVEEAVQAPETGVREAPPLRGSEAILLVEDENSVRALARRILERYGYEVLEARSGEEALDTARRHSGPIQLLLTDVVMPGVAGSELASQIAALRPEAKVLFMSGYTDDAIVRHGLIDQGGRFVQKPFRSEALARKVREVLDAKET